MRLFLPILDNGQGDIKADFLHCLLAAFAGRSIETGRISDSHPGRARNRAAAFFLRSEATHLLFIDGDIKFTAQHLDWLAESDAPVLGGIYCLKDPHQVKPCLQTLPDFPGGPLPDTLFAVARTGTGFLRIAREVFERMRTECDCLEYDNHGALEWDFFSSGVVNREWLSEDWAFCDRARELGYSILVDPRLQLLHRGEVDFPILPPTQSTH